MATLIIDELDRIDAAFAGNRLLATFAADTRALFEADATIIELQEGQQVLRPGESVSSSLFPFASTMISLVREDESGRSVEVASIGREGAVGGIVSCGHAPAFASAVVLIPGPALRLPLRSLEEAKSRSSFISHIFCRYSDFLLAQVMQSVACNAFHSIQQRAARWLLTAQDRAGDRIELTQEALAALLGAQRTTINAVIGSLQADGLISSRRGVVQVTDRAGLKRRACECHRVVESHFADVIGPSGAGATGG